MEVYAQYCHKRVERMTQSGAKKGSKKPSLEELQHAKVRRLQLLHVHVHVCVHVDAAVHVYVYTYTCIHVIVHVCTSTVTIKSLFPYRVCNTIIVR